MAGDHNVVSHLLASFTLAVCHEKHSWRDTWDDLADEYFEDHVDRLKHLVERKFGEDGLPGL